MSAAEMIEQFLLLYDINGGIAVGFDDSEIYEFLTKAQLDVVEEVYAKYGSSALPNLITKSQDNISATSELGQYNGLLNHYTNDGLFVLRFDAVIKERSFPITLNDQPITIERIDVSDVGKFVLSPLNKTVFDPKIVLNRYVVTDVPVEDFRIYADSYTTIKDVTEGGVLETWYIRKPTPIADAQSAEIDLIWHQKIVDKAVSYAMIATADARTQAEEKLNHDGL